MKVIIDFGDGITREYSPMDFVDQPVKEGYEFHFSCVHPNFGEKFSVGISKPTKED